MTALKSPQESGQESVVTVPWLANLYGLIAALILASLSATLLHAQRHTLAERPELVFKSGHSSSLAAICFSPDGSLIASAGNDNRLLVWEAVKGKLRWVLYGHKAPLTAIGFGPFNKTLVSADRNGVVFVWNMATGRRERAVVPAKPTTVTAVSVSPDGHWLAVGDANGIRLENLNQHSRPWNLSVPVCQSLLPVVKRIPSGGRLPPCEAEKIVFSKDSKLLASAHMLGTVNLFDLTTGRNLFSKVVPAHVYSSGAVSSSGAEIAFGPNNHLYSAGNDSGHLSVWDVTSSSELFIVKGYDVLAAAFSTDGAQLAATNTPILGQIRIWSIPSFQEMSPIQNSELLRLPLAASADKKLLAASGPDGVQIMRTDTQSSFATQSGPISPVSAVEFSADGSLLATEGTDARLRVWNLIEGKLKASIQTEFGTHAALSSDGHWTAYFNEKKRLTLRDFATGSPRVTRFSHPSIITPRVALSPDARWVSWNDPQLKLWSVGSASKPIVLCPGIEAGISAFSPDGQRIAAVCPSDQGIDVKVWSVSKPSEVQTLRTEIREPKTLVFSRGGNIGIGDLNRIVIWDLTSREIKTTLHSSSGEFFTAFAFAGKQDQFVIIADSDKDVASVKVWDWKKGIVVRSLLGHTSNVAAVAGCPNGPWVASGSDDGTTRLWNLDTGADLGVLIAVHPFTNSPDQWIVLTRKGLFDGSADGMKWVGWLEPHSTELFPLDTFFESFYSPGLLSDLFAGITPKRDFDIADKLRIPAFHSLFAQGMITLHQRQNSVFLCMPETPNVSILQSIEVRGGEGEILLAPDKFNRNDESAECAYEYELPFPLRDLEVAAKTFSRYKPMPTRWDKVVANFQEEKRLHSTLYVQTFGINVYPLGSGYDTLTYARPDARAVEDFFDTHARSIFENVRIGKQGKGLYDKEATRDAIRLRLEEMSKEVKADDVVVLFFSGHGGVPPGQELFYFIPADIGAKSPDQERESGLNTAMIAEALRNLPARRILLIIDACQSGGALDSLAHVAEIKLAIEERITERSAATGTPSGPAGVYVLAAATPFRLAVADSGYGHGLLTEAVLEVLRGSDGPSGIDVPNAEISARELNQRLAAAMTRVSVKVGYKQTPLIFSLGADIPLSRNGTEPQLNYGAENRDAHQR